MELNTQDPERSRSLTCGLGRMLPQGFGISIPAWIRKPSDRNLILFGFVQQLRSLAL